MKKIWRVAIPALVIVVWFAIASIGGPAFGKLSSVITNDPTAFLPASAQSTSVQKLQSQFATSTAVPAVVVIESDAPIPASLQPQFVAMRQKMQMVHGVAPATSKASGKVVGPLSSADKKAVEFIVPLTDNTKQNKAAVKALRRVVADNKPQDTKSYVTGPAGFAADLANAFGGIDGILVLVAVAAVFVILLLVYRAVLLPFIVLFTAIFALAAAVLVVYAFASWGWIKLNGQSQGILLILVIGAATDYSLLLTARFKEALHHTASTWEALRLAYRAAFAPIAASAATVILALLCLLFSDLNSNRSLGPIAAAGIVFSFLAALTLLPALLAAFGRGAFWPFKPKLLPESAHPDRIENPTGLEGSRGLWLGVGKLIRRHAALTAAITLVVLLAAMGGVLQFKANGVSRTAVILGSSNAVDGQYALARHFDAGAGSPVQIVAPQPAAQLAKQVVSSTNGITQVSVGTKVVDGNVLLTATLKDDPYSQTAEDVISALGTKLSRVDGRILVGGATATALDTNVTARHDLFKIIPIVLVVILAILIVLLRSLVAPLLLIATVAISYLASLGVSAIVFNHLYHFPGSDATIPLFGFVFLVALGVDYNIFLMTRVREESLRIGTRVGLLRALTVTGSVITSAGIVLAATFAALGVIPILFLAQIAFIVAFGVLLDTLIVRSLLVPALAYKIGKAIWWPSQLWKNGKP